MSTEKRLSQASSGINISDLPTVILDNGHGGIIDGVYQTSGKRSPVWEDGRILYEGEFNRDVVNRVIRRLKSKGYPYYKLVDTEEDTPLNQRPKDANAFAKTCENGTFLISVHANAGGGTGHETFTSPGQNNSDIYAEIMIEEFCKEFPELRLRADKEDGDHDKEAKFAMVMKTHMSAFLVECGFMDTLDPDCELLMSDEGRERYAKAIFCAIERIYTVFKK